jgi:hypothetical protein
MNQKVRLNQTVRASNGARLVLPPDQRPIDYMYREYLAVLAIASARLSETLNVFGNGARPTSGGRYVETAYAWDGARLLPAPSRAGRPVHKVI